MIILMIIKKNTLRQYEEGINEVMGVNYDQEKKEYIKKEDKWRRRTTKEKKEKCDNLGDNEKEQLRKYEKKGKEVIHINLDYEKRNI